MNNSIVYYTEPIQTKQSWVVEQYSANGVKQNTFNLGSQKNCWNFLQQINVYINGEVKYSGQ